MIFRLSSKEKMIKPSERIESEKKQKIREIRDGRTRQGGKKVINQAQSTDDEKKGG
jgi:hypothetical protein